MALRRNDTGNAVTRHQHALQAWNPDALPQWGADGDYGAETEAWVVKYQSAAQLDDEHPWNGVVYSVEALSRPDAPLELAEQAFADSVSNASQLAVWPWAVLREGHDWSIVSVSWSPSGNQDS